MVIQITGRHVDVPDKLKSFIETRVQKIGRFIDGVTDIHVTLSSEKHRQIAELNVHSAGRLHLSARESSDDMKTAVSQAVEKLEGQAKKKQIQIAFIMDNSVAFYNRQGLSKIINEGNAYLFENSTVEIIDMQGM